ncbi:hypothetical protein [Nodosilinea nodulosa]|uniref:hypothetical protein n=1 Tax=Nodosilinea nodulosa TaxID=416001 RepID=UPI00030BA8C0|nr:hypothetical protein [Nodosilinea nodulosa]
MAHITLQLSDNLAERLAPFRDRLPELLERGLRDLLNDSRTENGLDAEAIIALLARQPTPEQILDIQPSATLQSRVSELLAASKAGTLASKEEAELERYLTIEHLVRLAKAHAYGQLQKSA